MNVTGELSGAGGAPAHELMPATMYGEHGLTREEVLGKTSVELGLWEDPGLRAQYAERLARERVILDLEFPGYHKNGQRQVSQLSSALVTVNGEPCVLTIAHDITERRLAEQEVERSHQQLRALAAGLQRAREDERTMIAREIHDELGQALTGCGSTWRGCVHGSAREIPRRPNGSARRSSASTAHSTRCGASPPSFGRACWIPSAFPRQSNGRRGSSSVLPACGSSCVRPGRTWW